jgi:hypothetical protein
MTRILLITEKAIASLLIVWAVFVCYFFVGGIWALFDLGILQPMPGIEAVRFYHLFVLFPILMIVGGLFLLLGRKAGWTLSLASLIINGLFFLVPAERGKSVLTDSMSIAIFLSVAVLSFILFYILLLPGFRIRYRATKRSWFIVAAIAFLLLADKVILYLTS